MQLAGSTRLLPYVPDTSSGVTTLRSLLVQYVVHVYSRKHCFHSNSRDKALIRCYGEPYHRMKYLELTNLTQFCIQLANGHLQSVTTKMTGSTLGSPLPLSSLVCKGLKQPLHYKSRFCVNIGIACNSTRVLLQPISHFVSPD